MALIDLTSTSLPSLPPRSADSHKGDFGRVLLIGGSSGMSGAISLTGLAALRSGAGLVTLAVPRAIQNIVAGFSPCYMTLGLEDDGQAVTLAAADEALAAASSMDVVAIGPGLGRLPQVSQFVKRIYSELEQPMVVDADALFALSTDTLATPAGPRILTPHPGEFARLTGATVKPEQRLKSAVKLARELGGSPNRVVVVLKGNETVVTDGGQVIINSTGNPGMATGGTGDVLTGIITALIAQGLRPFEAARLGVYVHGLSGDLAAGTLGYASLIASDVIDFLPLAFQSLDNTEST